MCCFLAQAEAEREYKKKVADLELQTAELRKRNSKELADSVHQKIKEVDRQGNEMRRKMTAEYQQKVGANNFRSFHCGLNTCACRPLVFQCFPVCRKNFK